VARALLVIERMATKFTVPRPNVTKKVQPQEIALDANDLVEEEADNTEPSTSPPVFVAVEAAPSPIPIPIPIPTPTLIPPPTLTPPPAPTLTPLPAPRVVAMSLPSEYELDSQRKSSPPVAMRRKELAKYVASAVGVAWFICTCAIGETAFRSLIGSLH
jgi:hypothetical protein